MRGFDRPRSCNAFLAALAVATLGRSASGTAAEPSRGASLPSGAQLFQEHCATCHGSDGTGNGPMAQVLKVAPTDLTQITIRAGGTFPADRIAEIIRYGGNIAGTRIDRHAGAGQSLQR